jgi:hypothetical protein
MSGTGVKKKFFRKKDLDSSSSYLKDSRKSNFLRFSAPGGTTETRRIGKKEERH